MTSCVLLVLLAGSIALYSTQNMEKMSNYFFFGGGAVKMEIDLTLDLYGGDLSIDDVLLDRQNDVTLLWTCCSGTREGARESLKANGGPRRRDL